MRRIWRHVPGPTPVSVASERASTVTYHLERIASGERATCSIEVCDGGAEAFRIQQLEQLLVSTSHPPTHVRIGRTGEVEAVVTAAPAVSPVSGSGPRDQPFGE